MLTPSELFVEACSLQDSEDYKNAFALFKQAAELGDASSQNNLAVCYELGQGVPADMEQALYWYGQAVSNGEVTSLGNMADLYAKLSQFDKAEYWYLEAVKLGDGDALLSLSNMLLNIDKSDVSKARVISLLKKACISENITPDSKTEVNNLLRTLI